MQHRDGYFPGRKNLSIYRQTWLPDGVIRAAVVIVHGLGEHSARYRQVAEHLVQAGCAVYALDHRGHGKSEGSRAVIDRFANAVHDIDQVVELARREQRGKPVFMLGHSMGGALALSYTLQHAAKLKGLILSGPAVAIDGAPPYLRHLSKFLSVIAPWAGLFAIPPSTVSRDESVVSDYASDPLNHHGKVPARTLAEIVTFVEWLPAAAPGIKLPLLIQHGSKDVLAGLAGSEMLMRTVSSKDKTLKVYDGLFHEIYNELPEDRARVLADLQVWIEAHVS